jgi:hypothetical protein
LVLAFSRVSMLVVFAMDGRPPTVMGVGRTMALEAPGAAEGAPAPMAPEEEEMALLTMEAVIEAEDEDTTEDDPNPGSAVEPAEVKGTAEAGKAATGGLRPDWDLMRASRCGGRTGPEMRE